MSFGMWTRMGPRNHVLDGVSDHPREGALLMGDDVGNSPLAVDRRSVWLAAEAVECHIKFSE